MKRILPGALCVMGLGTVAMVPAAGADDPPRSRTREVADKPPLEDYAESSLMFATGSAELDDETREILDRLALWLLRNPHKKLLLQQAVPNTGDPNFAGYEALAERRVNAIRRHVAARGLDGSRVGYLPLDGNTRDQIVRKEGFYTVVMMTSLPPIWEPPAN
jgi:outer membrane protein OmpA-like peptidoglycan-associated protein